MSLRSAAALTVCGEFICKFFGHPTFFPGSGRFSRGIISRTTCTWYFPCVCLNFASRNPRFFSVVLYSWGMRRWTSTNADTLSAICGKPQAGRCHRQILLLLKCYSFYKHAKQRAASCPLSYHDCQKIYRDNSFC